MNVKLNLEFLEVNFKYAAIACPTLYETKETYMHVMYTVCIYVIFRKPLHLKADPAVFCNAIHIFPN